MLTQFRWCISVALCLDAQPIGSTTDPVLPSVARRVPLAESEPKQNGMTRAVTQIASLDWRPPDGEVDEFLPYLSAAHFSYRQLKTKTGSRARQYSLGQYSLGQCSLERPFRNFVPCFSQGSFLIRRSPRLVLSLRTQ
jgi:hypothetical protein